MRRTREDNDMPTAQHNTTCRLADEGGVEGGDRSHLRFGEEAVEGGAVSNIRPGGYFRASA